LIELITQYPDHDADKRRCQNHPFTASEVLGDASPLHEKIVESPDLMSQFFEFLHQENPNSTLVGYFSKVLVAMISRCPERATDYLVSSGSLLKFPMHMSHKGFYDISLKLLLLDNIQYPSVLSGQKTLLQLLTQVLKSGSKYQVSNSSQVIVDLIFRSSENLSKDLMEVLISNETIQVLFECLQSAESFRIVASVNILKSLLQANLKVSLKSVTEHYFSGEVFKENLRLIIAILNERQGKRMVNTMKNEYEPLGDHRLKIVELVAVLLRIPDDNLVKALAESGVFKAVYDLFFEYPWTSFLHNLFEGIVVNALASQNEDLFQNFILSQDFLNKIIQTSKQENQRHRLGNLGIVHKIANLLKNCGNPLIFEKLTQNVEWKQFIVGYLDKRNKIDQLQLGDLSRKFKNPSSEGDFENFEKVESKIEPSEEKEEENQEEKEMQNVEDSQEKIQPSIEVKDEVDQGKENYLKGEEQEKKEESGAKNTLEIEIDESENSYKVDVLNKKSPLAQRRLSGGPLSPSGNPEFSEVNYWKMPILVDELDGIELE
jgi:hypothetical protein